ncbi:MAG: DinB family protein [Aggregatilineales bacterium]
MPTAQQQVHIDTLRAFPAELDALLETIPESELDSRITPDEWCTRQIVHHLADAHTRSLLLIKTALFEESPAFIGWKQGEFAETADYKLPVGLSVAIIHSIHERIATLLESLDDDQWQRTGIHPRHGEMTIEALARLYAGHCGIHVAQINKTLGRSS